MAKDLKAYKIFIATPGGLESERKAFRDVIASYNESDANHRGVHFMSMGWEITLGGVGRPQALINEEIRNCDYFLLMLWDRWGSSPNPTGQEKFTSGSEEEYSVAWESIKDETKPMRQIVALFKAVEARQLSDPGDQLKKVLEFKRKLELEKSIMFQTFDELDAFKEKLRCYLARWLRDHEGGSSLGIPTPNPPALPSATSPARPREMATSISSPDLEKLIKEAWDLANQGQLTDAETKFAEAAVRGDVNALNSYGQFLARIGRLQQAEEMYERVRQLAKMLNKLDIEAVACGNLSLLFDLRGDRKRAEQFIRTSLDICRKIGDQEGVASSCVNLGTFFAKWGDMNRSEEMFRKAFAIYERSNDQEGLAMVYSNLGIIFRRRNDIVQAEQMHRKAIEIDKRIGNEKGLAVDIGGLGMVYLARNDLAEAERLFREALQTHERLGDQGGMRDCYANIGAILIKRGELTQGEQMIRKALRIDEQLGDSASIAKRTSNLAVIFKMRGDDASALELWTIARDLFLKAELAEHAKEMQSQIDDLQKQSPPTPSQGV